MIYFILLTLSFDFDSAQPPESLSLVGERSRTVSFILSPLTFAYEKIN
jgi:hypothetical protein